MKEGFGQTISPFEFAALKKGKHCGFNAAYSAYADHVYSLSIHIVGNEHTASDILQAVFETLLVKSNTLKSEETLGAWLKQCTLNACMGYFRRSKQENLFIESQGITESISMALEDKQVKQQANSRLSSFLEQLPFIPRSVVYFYAVHGLKHNEIAPSLGINESNSRQIYRRTLSQLKSWLNKAD